MRINRADRLKVLRLALRKVNNNARKQYVSEELKRGFQQIKIQKITILFVLILIFCLAKASFSQAVVDNDDNQFWNDIQITAPLSKQVDFNATVTTRFGKNVTRLNDGRFAAGFTFKLNKSWSLQPFYQFINARNSRSQFRIEHRLNLRIGYRFPIKSFGLSHRSTFEYRIRQPQNSWRYRPLLTIEKELPKKFLPDAKIYATEEVFYDSQLNKFSRNRFTVGLNKILNKKLSLDVYFMRQNDGFSRPGDLNVIGANWRIKL